MNELKKYFVTGIDTEIGKTITAAVLTEALEADYWKPIQSGDLDYSDTDKVRELVSNTKTKFHSNSYALSTPVSPHLSAKIDKQDIDIEQITLNNISNNLIVEGAGGIMVPLSEKVLLLDLIKQLNYETIVVSKNYLGSINHTLLSLEILKQNNIKIKGIIFNGKENEETERYILQYAKIDFLGRVPFLKNKTKGTIKKAAEQFKFLKNG